MLAIRSAYLEDILRVFTNGSKPCTFNPTPARLIFRNSIANYRPNRLPWLLAIAESIYAIRLSKGGWQSDKASSLWEAFAW
jgi:hypothetical protein